MLPGMSCGRKRLRISALSRPGWRRATKQLRFSQGEDLLRLCRGGRKHTHTPDVRYNFWVGQAALRSKSWKNLEWIPESLKSLFLTLLKLVATELPQLTDEDWEPRGSLGANILAGAAETWAGSRLRNSLHTNTGSCAEHTDYGVIQVGAFLSILSRGWG